MKIGHKTRSRAAAVGLALFALVVAPIAFALTPQQRAALMAFAANFPTGPSTPPSQAVAVTDTGTPITGQTISAGGQGITGWLSQIYSAAVAPLAAGTNVIGKVGIDQTTPGTTNGVSLTDGTTAPAAIKAASTPSVATDKALVVDVRPNCGACSPNGPAAASGAIPVIISTEYPANNVTTTPTPAAAVAAGSTGAVSATIAAVTLAKNYLCEIEVSAIGGTAAVGPVTITGLLGGTRTVQLSSSASGVTYQHNWRPCLPTSAVNTAIVAATTADGTATAVDVNISGYTE